MPNGEEKKQLVRMRLTCYVCVVSVKYLSDLCSSGSSISYTKQVGEKKSFDRLMSIQFLAFPFSINNSM